VRNPFKSLFVTGAPIVSLETSLSCHQATERSIEIRILVRVQLNRIDDRDRSSEKQNRQPSGPHNQRYSFCRDEGRNGNARERRERRKDKQKVTEPIVERRLGDQRRSDGQRDRDDDQA